MKYLDIHNGPGETSYGRCKAALTNYGFPDVEPEAFTDDLNRTGHKVPDATLKAIRAKAA